MQDDEREIRDLVANWHAASRAGDIEAVLSFMTDDVVFLVPGRPPMGKQEFASLSRPPEGSLPPRIETVSEIQEVQVTGDWAFMRTKLSMVITAAGAEPLGRAGHTLSVLQRLNGKWLLARDANLLTPSAIDAAAAQ